MHPKGLYPAQHTSAAVKSCMTQPRFAHAQSSATKF
jgi:hypothetical protein